MCRIMNVDFLKFINIFFCRVMSRAFLKGMMNRTEYFENEFKIELLSFETEMYCILFWKINEKHTKKEKHEINKNEKVL